MTKKQQAILLFPRVRLEPSCVYPCVSMILVDLGRTKDERDRSVPPSTSQAGSCCSGNRNKHFWAPTVCSELPFLLHHDPGRQLLSPGYEPRCCPGGNGAWPSSQLVLGAEPALERKSPFLPQNSDSAWSAHCPPLHGASLRI